MQIKSKDYISSNKNRNKHRLHMVGSIYYQDAGNDYNDKYIYRWRQLSFIL
jgi:hypothetical protein